MASKFFKRRLLVLLALLVVAYVSGKFGWAHPHYGFWDGPVGG